MANTNGFYIFGAIQASEKQTLGKVHLAEEERLVYTVPYKDIAMVVTEAPVQIYEPTRTNLRAHQEVVSQAMELQSIIPMSFGNVLETEKDVKILLENLYGELEEIFPKIENKMEVGLKVIADKKWLAEEAQKNSSLQSVQQTVESKSSDAGYYDKIRLGEAAKNFMLNLQKDCENTVFRPLAEIADAAKSNEVINERMLLNAAFLVDWEQEEAFDEKVNKVFEKWEGKADFKYTGPWPAYNFIDIKLKAADTP